MSPSGSHVARGHLSEAATCPNSPPGDWAWARALPSGLLRARNPAQTSRVPGLQSLSRTFVLRQETREGEAGAGYCCPEAETLTRAAACTPLPLSFPELTAVVAQRLAPGPEGSPEAAFSLCSLAPARGGGQGPRDPGRHSGNSCAFEASLLCRKGFLGSVLRSYVTCS